MLNAGVIGTGYLGNFHAEKYNRSHKVKLVGVYDEDRARAEDIAGKYGCQNFNSPDALLSAVDLVSVVVPTVRHYHVSKRALEKKIHVLVEKPICANVWEADELILLAKRQQCKLQVGHLEQFNPAFQATQPLINNPLYIESLRIAPYVKRNIDVDILLDLMIHDIHLVLQINNHPIQSTDALGATVLSDSYDISSLRLKFANNCVADLKASRLAEKTERKIRIFQPNSCLVIDFHKQKQTTFIARKNDDGTVANIEKNEIRFERHDQILIEIESFIDAINNDSVPAVTGETARHALSVALNAIEKIKQTSV